MSQEYIIEHISDILKIPEDKAKQFFAEIGPALQAAYYTVRVVNAVDKNIHGKKTCDFLLPRMVWKDDGEKGVTINLKNPELLKEAKA